MASAIDNIVGVAKYISDVGYKTYSSYMYSEPQGAVSASSEKDTSSTVGTVIVYDVCTSKVITHFKAHKEAIALLAFDPSGTLVCSYIDPAPFSPNQ